LPSLLKLFKDESLTTPVRQFLFPRTEIGSKSEITFYLYNESEKWPILAIKHIKTHDDVSIDSIPQRIPPKGKAKCNAVYRPSVETDSALTTIVDIKSELHIG